MIYVVLQWQKRNVVFFLSNIEVLFGEIRIEVGVEIRLLGKVEVEFDVLFDDIVIESEVLFSDIVVEVRVKIGGIVLDQVLFFGDDDVGEGFFFLIREKFVFKQNENEEENFDKEQIGNLKQELDDKSVICKVYLKCFLFGLVLIFI